LFFAEPVLGLAEGKTRALQTNSRMTRGRNDFANPRRGRLAVILMKRLIPVAVRSEAKDGRPGSIPEPLRDKPAALKNRPLP
jgi:hypothetical protein